VLLLEYLDRSFETSDDVSQVLSLPTLGTIPQLHGRERRTLLATSTDPRSAVSEAYRTLRTNIRFISIDSPLKTLLVTSAEPAVGKTTVTTNLGIVCAQAGLRVVLLDADLRRSQQHDLFDLENQRGLANLLVGDVPEAKQCALRTGIDDLYLIPSGPLPPNPSELLDSTRMEAVLAQVSKSADLVILDSPPVLAVTDAATLGPKVDGVILVITARRTSHEAARKAYEALQSVDANVLGVVLVSVKRRGPAYYYYPAQERSPKRSTQKRYKWVAKLQGRWRLTTGG
jgi:capsular exopolysaccharide synthesis family protein